MQAKSIFWETLLPESIFHLIQSEQFTFYVGQAGKPIVVHSAAIAATSQHLDALINGGMGEAATRCAQIKDVEIDDFIRFCEYAYRGDYTTPPWEDDLQEPIPNGDANDWGDTWGSTSKKKKKSKKSRVETVPDVYEAVPAPEDPPIDEYPAEPVACEEEVPPADIATPDFSYHPAHVSRIELRARLKSRIYLDNDNPKAQILQRFEPKPNTAVTQNFTPVLLAHARLYCFAHLRLIEPLKAVTLDKLHKTLMSFGLYTERVGDVIKLARFAYSNAELPDRKDDGSIDDLRKLIVEYIVCEIDTIGKCDDFVKYMEDGGEFVGDFWRLARDHVV
ncbi:hypothetical protein E8E13_009412 [Curvularia kusanoi]|uniref:BTB domain-containing protein n=1 Tax=Curvularia kusanoi TaxID=90978 RepID=A0A9P4TGL8_CURKU|nr:hypothetical protein E8E13_009412 [Curvularia kusanoi]